MDNDVIRGRRLTKRESDILNYQDVEVDWAEVDEVISPLITTDTYTCKYYGKEKSWNDRSYDVGLWLAEVASFEALGHTEYVTPYLICNQCADEVIQESI